MPPPRPAKKSPSKPSRTGKTGNKATTKKATSKKAGAGSKAATKKAAGKTTSSKKAVTKKAVTKKAGIKKAETKKPAVSTKKTKAKASSKPQAAKSAATNITAKKPAASTTGRKTKATANKTRQTKTPQTKKKVLGTKAAAASKSAPNVDPKREVAVGAPAAPTRNGHAAAPPPPPPTTTDDDPGLVENPYERLHRELPESELAKVKSGLTKKDLKTLTQALYEHRAELLGDVQGLDEALHGDVDGSSSVPLHMADVGSEHYEREFNLELLEHEKHTLNEIRAALLRIDNGTYGVCINTGRPIGKLRLEAKPWAKYHMDVVREREKYNL